MEDMQKGTYATDLEVPSDMEVDIEPGVQDPACILHAPALVVPGSNEANVEEMEYTEVQSPVSPLLTFSEFEDSPSLLTDDGSEDDGEWV